MSEKNVRFGIASSRNITFNYVDDSGYTQEEWDSFTYEIQDEILQEFIYANIDVWVVADDVWEVDFGDDD
jgi:hypothetical protein